MTLALMLLAMAFNLFDQLSNAADVAGTAADVNQNLRTAVNLIARDLTTGGGGIPLGGIPLPGGGVGPATAIKRPWPTTSTFNSPNGGFMPVITPGPGLGPASGTFTTDVVTVISVNPISQLNQYPLTAIVSTPTSATITVDSRTNIASGVSQVVTGQLITLVNSSSCMLAVTAVNTVLNTITFTAGDVVNDVLGLNQFSPGAATGTIAQLPPVAANTTAYHVNMITYFLDTSTPKRLMRQVGTATPQPVALGIKVLQFSYSLSPPATPTDPTNNPSTPNQIRKANLWVVAEADHSARKSQRYYSNSIATSVTVQNLAYFNKY